MQTTRNRTAIIIGAGLGGLATAAHLAQQGFQVTVLEKNKRVGGRCDRIERDGYSFDTGPTLYVMPKLYQSELGHLGLSADEAFDLQRVDPNYHLYFEDGSRLALTSDLEHLSEQIERMETGSSEKLLDYLEEGSQHYELALKRLVQRDFRRVTDFFKPGNIPLIFQVKAFTPHYQHMGRYFDDPRLKAAFTFQDMYMGLSPFEAPTTFSLMQYSELAHGVWYPRGGMYRIVKTLQRAAEEAGAQIYLSTGVERIETNEHRALGVRIEDGETLNADIIVANADLPYVYEALLPTDGMMKRLERKRYSCSTLSFFWGLDRRLPKLEPHMLFLADDYRGGFQALNGSDLPERPSLYVHTPTRLDPSLAPDGCDSVIGIVPVGNLDALDGTSIESVRDQARDAIFERLASIGMGEVREHITFEVCFTPCSWQKRYNLYRGATHGLSHTLNQLAYLRPHNRHRRYRNLYFVGASTHPGTGLPTVLVSARLAAERILDELDEAHQ